MKRKINRQIRRGVFETNSSSVHSLTMCTKEQYEEWKSGKVLFDKWGSERFVSANSLTETQKLDAKTYYENTKNDFYKNWEELSEKAKEKYYTKYAKENDLIDEDAVTYEAFFDNWEYEHFEDTFTTPNGETVIAFGYYGHD